MKKFTYCILFFAFLVLFLFLFGFGPLVSDRVVTVPKANGREITEFLYNENIIRNRLAFRFLLKISGKDKDFLAGEFEIKKHQSPLSIIFYISQPKNIYLHNITFPEGLRSSEIKDIINANENLLGDKIKYVPEGIVLPETYKFEKGMDRQDLLIIMKDKQKTFIDENWHLLSKDSPIKSKKELIILASIIEKEAKYKDERPLIASVFINRLKKRMRLQSDPTVLYGRGKDSSATITRSDLNNVNSYNTYRINGLPIGPIANPGKASILSALQPAKTNYIYFVASGNGRHYFSSNLQEHNKMVERWRKVEKEINSRD